MIPIRIVNFADIAVRDWRFLEGQMQPMMTSWSFYSSTPQFWIEHFVKRPNLARLRASFCAGLRASNVDADVIISHLPRATVWLGIFSRMFLSRARHLAFSFNFTVLPSGINKRLMRYAFRKVDRFVVFSEAEKSLYASYFALDINRFDVVRWCMDVPRTAVPERALPGKFICAVGGEGRDYQALLTASRLLPGVPLVIVARPSSLLGLDIPAHVLVFTNIKNEEFWGIVQKSSFVVLPLKDANTNCGHITIVGSQLLGKPIVSTYSTGTSDYLQQGHNALMGMAGDSHALGTNIQKLWEDQMVLEMMRTNVLRDGTKYAVSNWVAYFERYFDSLRTPQDSAVPHGSS